MNGFRKRLADRYFGDGLDIRAKIFNAVMFIMAVTWTIGAFLSMRAARGESLAGVPALFCAGLIACLIWYANKSGNYKRCYWIITIVMFMGQAAIAFFLNGGYKSGGIFALFITNVALASFLFDGKKAIIVPFILIVEYVALCIYAYYYPDKINYFDEQNRFFSTVSILIVASVSISAIIILHLRLYDKQKRELEAARNEAEEARKKAVEYEKMKSDFFAEMSHELRTPLSVIAINSQMVGRWLKSGSVTDQAHTFLQAINREAIRLANMTDCALTTLTTPFESGGAEALEEECIPAPMHIGDVIGVITGIVRPAVIQSGMDMVTDIDESLPPIEGDAEALTRLLLNLLHNAVNHSGGKHITIRARKFEDTVKLIVEDDGKGIPPELLPSIFDRGVSGTGSTGLGLYVCKRIAQEHKGDIRIENKDDAGTRVTVTLPLV